LKIPYYAGAAAATAAVETNVRNKNYIHSDWLFYPLLTKPSQQSSFTFKALLSIVNSLAFLLLIFLWSGLLQVLSC
jgi:hypothetical protein